MTALRPSCLLQGYSDCGPDEYDIPEGTSFAAPQVSAAAALLFAVDPELTNDQATSLLEHTADDVNATNGCAKCAQGRDFLSGWGRLDIAKAIAALTATLPAPDRYETNDDAGTQARTLWGKQVKVTATVDYYDDQIDVYRVALTGGERVAAKLTGDWANANVDLVLWKPGTSRVNDLRTQTMRAAQSIVPGSTQRVNFEAPGRGWYYVEVKVTSPGAGPYTLTLTKTTP
jgi:subtilisin family serine protease